jgi:hypothetical protein
MAPRHPPDRPEDDKPSNPRQAVRNENAPATKHPAPRTEQDASQPAEAEDDELDRIEAYLRGPTAFTA